MSSRFFESARQALAYCLLPRVWGLVLAPLLAVAIVLGLGFFWTWGDLVVGLNNWLADHGVHQSLQRVLSAWVAPATANQLVATLAQGLLLLWALLLGLLLVLVIVSVWLTPALTNLVAARRFPQLARRGDLPWWTSLAWALKQFGLAVLMLVISLPLWLIPGVVLVWPPAVFGWMSSRIMAFDTLAEHADAAERRQLLASGRGALFLIGLLTTYLGAAPSVVWISGLLFAALFAVLAPVAVLIYSGVVAFTALWFAHFQLSALQALRAKADGGTGTVAAEGGHPLAARR